MAFSGTLAPPIAHTGSVGNILPRSDPFYRPLAGCKLILYRRVFIVRERIDYLFQVRESFLTLPLRTFYNYVISSQDSLSALFAQVIFLFFSLFSFSTLLTLIFRYLFQDFKVRDFQCFLLYLGVIRVVLTFIGLYLYTLRLIKQFLPSQALLR